MANLDFSVFSTFYFYIKMVGGFLVAIFIAGITYNVWRLTMYNRRQISEIVKFVLDPIPKERASRWDKIKSSLVSDNPADWKLAIVDADNIIDDILKKAGYRGNNLGERLIKLRPYMFKGLLNLLKAHITRNRISKNGNGHDLTREKASEILGYYEDALKELGYIE